MPRRVAGGLLPPCAKPHIPSSPRYPTLPGIMKAKKKPLEEIPLASLGVTSGARVKYVYFAEPPARKAGELVPDVDTLLQKLKNEAKVL